MLWPFPGNRPLAGCRKFGTLSAIAILTKGNGFYLALVSPIAVLLSRRFDLLKRVGFGFPRSSYCWLRPLSDVLTMHPTLPTFDYL